MLLQYRELWGEFPTIPVQIEYPYFLQMGDWEDRGQQIRSWKRIQRVKAATDFLSLVGFMNSLWWESFIPSL